jgi:hydrogenase expression/formation protein HypC
MCLGIPGRVIQVEPLTALVDIWGVKKRVRLEIVDEVVRPGDYVLIHVGFAIRRIPPEQVQETLALYDQLIKAADEDLMASDIRGEVRATGDSEL